MTDSCKTFFIFFAHNTSPPNTPPFRYVCSHSDSFGSHQWVTTANTSYFIIIASGSNDKEPLASRHVRKQRHTVAHSLMSQIQTGDWFLLDSSWDEELKCWLTCGQRKTDCLRGTVVSTNLTMENPEEKGITVCFVVRLIILT